VESVVGAVAEKEWLLIVSSLVEVVPELVVDRCKVLGRGLNAHLDTQIVHVVDVPSTGMADYVTIGRLRKQRPLPEGRRQQREA
jgi:hypothetical protein